MIDFKGNFSVAPSLPEKLEPLIEIANNLYWSWNKDSIELFRRLDNKLWEKTHHNPVLLLGKISQERLKEVVKDDGFIAHMNRVLLDLRNYLMEVNWYQKNYKADDSAFVAYFSAEFGLTECLQIYSGGLGILAGDHMKSASDLGIPLVGVGLCYKEGYFQQYLTSDGWQQERYELTDFINQPMSLVKGENNEPLIIELDFPGRKVSFQVWKIQVGRTPLYLLDTNISQNSDEDKSITRTLYGGSIETRIQQEILLGIGGIRTLHALGVRPQICHMNEGHSAFLALERIRTLIKNESLTFSEAKDIGYYSNVFTTHTPVPAGIDVFPNELVEKYFGKYYRNELKLSDKEFYKLGTILQDREPYSFNMAHLAMNMAGFVNGVSKLHGEVSKKMWVEGFKGIPFDEIPIDYVTNGIHTRSHISNEMEELLYRYLGERFIQSPGEEKVWERIHQIPDEELWRTHERRRERLVAFARKTLYKQVVSRGGSASEAEATKEVLNPAALTIGFARRFATYKRATILYRDIERLASILCDVEEPVQLIIAGKAHPKDDAGKKLIQEIIRLAKQDPLRKKIVFLENYDMNTARYMVEGCDIWLNNPRRPLEASGTSGMKVIANGGLNFSVLDGWWDEGYDPELGWKIGNGEEYVDLDYQDEIESRLIYETLEKEIVPTFYDRGEDKLPRSWIAMMKASMSKLGPFFNTERMVKEYVQKFYLKAYEKRKFIMANDWEKAKAFTKWKESIMNNWKDVRFVNYSAEGNGSEIKVGTDYVINAEVSLGNLTPNDVDVQIYYGKKDDMEKPYSNKNIPMECQNPDVKSGNFKYKGVINCESTGYYGYTLRILPHHPLFINQFELGQIKWA